MNAATTARRTLPVLAVALLIGVPCISSSARDQQDAGTAVTRPQVSDGDQTFARSATLMSMRQMGAAQLATERARSGEVRSYARHMLDRHRAIHADLVSFAQRKEFGLPRDMPEADKATIDAMNKRDAAAFDRTFLQDFGIRGQGRLLEVLESTAKRSSNDELRSWAARRAADLKEDIAQATRLQRGG